MGILSRAADLGYAFRFLKLLTTPWNKLKAYELGIVDANGKNIKKAKQLETPEEKAARKEKEERRATGGIIISNQIVLLSEYVF